MTKFGVQFIIIVTEILHFCKSSKVVMQKLFSQSFNLLYRQIPPAAQFQIPERNRALRNPSESCNLQIDHGTHSANLPVSAFVNYDLKLCPIPFCGNQSNCRRTNGVTVQSYRFLKQFFRTCIETGYPNFISFFHFMLGMHQHIGKFTVICEQ